MEVVVRGGGGGNSTVPQPQFRLTLCIRLATPGKLDGLLEDDKAVRGPGDSGEHGALRPQKPSRLIRDGEVRGSGIFISDTRYTVTTRMTLH